MYVFRLMIVVAALAFSSVVQADVLFVDDDADLGGDGLSWDTAYRFLQDAFADAASSGGTVTEIRVAQGNYLPDRDEANLSGTGDRSASFRLFFLFNGVTINGGYAGLPGVDPDARDITLYESILSGDLDGNDGPQFANNDGNSYNVVMSFANANGTAELSNLRLALR